jgi:hypothetical protein
MLDSKRLIVKTGQPCAKELLIPCSVGLVRVMRVALNGCGVQDDLTSYPATGRFGGRGISHAEFSCILGRIVSDCHVV